MPNNGIPEGIKKNPLSFIRVATQNLKIIIERHQATHSEEKFNHFIQNIRQVFEQYYSALAEFDQGVDRALVAHRLANNSIQQSNTQSSCSRGCSACCFFEVEITTDEGILLTALINGGIEIDQARLNNQAARAKKSPEWGKFLNESNRCIFLGPDQTCRIYDFRPLVCRKHMVSSPPSDCSNGTDIPILLPLTEIALSAALSQPGNTFNSLSKTLTEILGETPEKSSPQDVDLDLPLEF